MAILGSASEYTCRLFDRYGRGGHYELEASQVEWSRTLDDTSSASVVVPYGDPECCRVLSQARTWCQDLGLFRDSQLVWQGPVVEIAHDQGQTQLDARDVSQWLFRRVPRTLLDFTGPDAADLSRIAEALVREGYSQDDPNVLAYLHVDDSGILAQKRYAPESGYILDHLREIARTGVDWTVIGHRLIITGEKPIARLHQLTDDDFLAGLRVREAGLSAVTSAIVLGQGVRAEAGGIGTCGLLEYLANEDHILDQESAQAAAEALVDGGDPSPLILEVPDGSQLAPDAPVGIQELIPGVAVPIASVRTCRRVAAELRLTAVRVSWSEGSEGGEQVGVTLQPRGVPGQIQIEEAA
ncbi:hypothetical protein [Nonomuraea salmonea]|uniref:Uncharacterized protein n=1 Tax=Nonomuraea salmonea TaxID=46181 RepID=A0ABV5P315_9ACTN